METLLASEVFFLIFLGDYLVLAFFSLEVLEMQTMFSSTQPYQEI